MELEFESSVCPYLHRSLREVQHQEQTLEVRLTDGMPDIGSILAAWGQCILRGKEWRSEEATVSGGVMVWVLYLPADGGEPRTLEAWLPIQQKWTVPDCRREGVIRTQWSLKNVDARTLSVRKLMVRAGVEILAQVLEPRDVQLFAPGELPGDIQLLRREYPMMLPVEAGEKTLQIEDDLPLPEGVPQVKQILYCTFKPMLTDQKLQGQRAAFQGKGCCHVLYMSGDGSIHTADLETAFSQLEDLEKEYDAGAQLSVMPEVTSFEPELQEEQLHLKAGITLQYLICEEKRISLAEDAYSTMRDVAARTDALAMPSILDTSRRIVEQEIPVGTGRILDVAVYPRQPVVRRRGELAELEFPGNVQILSLDENGSLMGSVEPWTEIFELPVHNSVKLDASVVRTEPPQVTSDVLSFRMETQTDAVSTDPVVMMTGLELGDPRQADPARPSVILKRPGEASLWELAKSCGSTVDAICQANGISQEPLDNRILLIPIA